jgi:tRNA nucleotidyltransferase (CCA-adding enzyme)
LNEQPYPQRQRLLGALNAAQSVSTAEVAAAAEAQGLSGAAIGQAVHTARTQTLNSWLAN